MFLILSNKMQRKLFPLIDLLFRVGIIGTMTVLVATYREKEPVALEKGGTRCTYIFT
jgi:hypothetical protein